MKKSAYTINVRAIKRFFNNLVLSFIAHNKRKADRIDRIVIFPSKVLNDCGQEPLREEETADPEDLWDSVLDPLRYEVKSLKEVLEPAGEGL